ncbi:class I SAM-dependent DNA methyltransferase [Leucobacter rhizosphaerae]|uniref:site-specific DNA-methyltransferase (adenine-specific) n=1 Tax=Leucobacter rhizosphaerae TaxID=2932245 RepID=A0ABY4FY09_9MICO|nr:DNA methyltransferase [Leucobacter rhizosphaerae]UOQ61183.1 class I SAM-dependent DNA methyltransferase [Leucobacter rhizosphaerae]
MNEIRTRAAQFIRDWQDEPGDERQQAQSFVRDLLGVYGITQTRAAFYEKRVKRSSTGSRGYIDALIPGLALIEMKSAGNDLVVAEKQALDYIDDLPDPEVPRWVLTSDFHRLRLLDLHADNDGVQEFTLTQLRDHADRLAFLAGYGERTFGSKAQEAASIRAAKLMASLYEALEESGYDDHEASVFLVRTLFALYADDAGVWDRDLFLEFLETRTAQDGSDLGPQLSLLYQVMGRDPSRRQSNLDELIARFPYVNGGIFEESVSIPSFDTAMRDRLIAAAMFNWSAISPAIFGSLFQAVKDKTARRELGEHYTTETNIMKVIGPMFLDELRQRFMDGYHDTAKLKKLRVDMGQMRFLDPACGCGNFLVVGYRQMRALDLEILLRVQQLSGDTARTMFFTEEHLSVRLSSFHGIELEEWPAQIAATALHLVEHQANQAMELALGTAPDSLPLNKIRSIQIDNALRTDWGDVVEPTEHLYIMGNPPFLGHATRSLEQAQELRDVWRRKDIGRLDYVTGWYAKSLELLNRPGYAGEFAFVSTNSIAQGEPVPALFGPVFAAAWRVKFAHRTFAWTSEAPGAAAVHCSVIGFDRTPKKRARLFEYSGNIKGEPVELPVIEQINGYLVDGPNVLIEQRRAPLAPELPPMVFGNMARDDGNLLIEAEDYNEVVADPVAAKYIRPFVGARQLIHNEPRWCLWLVDLEPSDIARSPVLRRRLDAVRQFRADSTAESTRRMAETPHLFGQRSQPDTPYVCVPRHASETRRYLPTAVFPPEVICGDANFKADDPDGIAFATISSSAFIAWQKTVGGRIKSDLRFSNTLTWNTFPLPPMTDKERTAIIAGGQAILHARALHPERSLADHYNPLAMSPELVRAHRELDSAVDQCLGLRGTATDESRLRALFSNYAKLTTTNELPIATKSSRRRNVESGATK